MFATRLIRAGELIIAERPTVLASKKVSPEPSFNDAALAALSDGARASFMALADSCSPELSHPLLGRIAINSFDSGPMTDDEDTLVEFAATYITLSRANHDCVGNANYQWLKTRWCGQFFAKRDIPAGEEITVSYTFALTQAERHAALKERYSCECLCKTCSDATPEDVRRSDQQRKMVAHVRDALQSALYSSLCPTVSEESLQRVLEHAQEEGMMISYATIAFLASRMLTKREGPVVALKWLKVARQAYVTTLGKEAWEVSQVDKHGWFLTTVLRSRGAVYSWP
ncbi:uncharacterized protein C8Q71DRAFT_729798 [Rhodofomes roseus]|uniref:SET domain-containing protein n=1 Tax=Rhodofomes roseus TaxID=34475 RepID=A0ABQ8KWQ1_9APHY|nr:uncharacterized protein C8Q71DRAFT_729798 [Rhodofomes roseus]KAH9843723.1 hypothetical protein C8Q71DRAFT_729798 [Rhodofomes roseus]